MTHTIKKAAYNKLAIIIPTYNRKEYLQRLLQRLANQELRHPAEIVPIVVVDGSTDGTLEMLNAEFPAVEIIEGDGNWWWTRSINEGIEHARNLNADAVLLMNDDTEIETAYLQTLLNDAEQHAGAVIGSINLTMGPEPLIYFSGIKKMVWWKAKYIRYHAVFHPYEPGMSGMHPSVFLLGRGFFIPIHVFDVTGLFDQEKFPQYKADFDFALTAHERGVPTLVTWNAPVYSHMEMTGKGATFTCQGFGSFLASFFKKNTYTNLRHSFRFYRKHCPLYLLPLSFTVDKLRLICSYWRKRKFAASLKNK